MNPPKEKKKFQLGEESQLCIMPRTLIIFRLYIIVNQSCFKTTKKYETWLVHGLFNHSESYLMSYDIACIGTLTVDRCLKTRNKLLETYIQIFFFSHNPKQTVNFNFLRFCAQLKKKYITNYNLLCCKQDFNMLMFFWLDQSVFASLHFRKVRVSLLFVKSIFFHLLSQALVIY